jgi:AcrR family transcriptional regulator
VPEGQGERVTGLDAGDSEPREANEILMIPEIMGASARVDTLMSPLADRPQEKNTELQKGRKSTQRDRLLLGMITAANREGYAHANVSAVIAQAKVSRPTFYDYFADKDDCFCAAIEEIDQQLVERVRASIRDAEPEQALRASVEALIRFTSEEPAMTRFLMNETMGAGPAALDVRDHGIGSIERLIQARYKSADRAALAPDISPRMLIGGIYRLLSPRLRRADPKISTLLGDLLRLIESYEQPLSSHRWRGLKPASRCPISPFVPEVPLQPPPPFPRGRLRLPEEEIAENQRQRIMFAAAELAQDKGYNATTMNEITKQAGVDGRAFYAMFADKQDAFMAVHELGFQHVMEVTANAFFSGATWPERNWEAGRAFTQFLEMNPLVANVGFIEAYAVGPGAVQRVEDSHMAFAMLLQEGYHHVRGKATPSRVVLETIITTIFEVIYARVRSGSGARLSGLVPHLTFLVLSPFVGPEQANAFIAQKLAASSKR